MVVDSMLGQKTAAAEHFGSPVELFDTRVSYLTENSSQRPMSRPASFTARFPLFLFLFLLRPRTEPRALSFYLSSFLRCVFFFALF